MCSFIPEIRKTTELVQILLYISDLHVKTPHQNYNNRQYCEAINNWFTPYKSHEAVRLTQELINNHHFNYTRPHEAAFRFDEIIANSNDNLYTWANEVKRFSVDSKFDDFFKCEADYYNLILSNIQSCNFYDWVTFIEKYFHSDSREFHLIICPLDGNYGMNVELNNKNVSFQVCCLPLYDSVGIAEYHLDYLAKNMAHEYGHCFVNPVVEKHIKMLSNHIAFFKTHTNIPDYYNLEYAVICEYFVRAFAIRFMENHICEFPDFNISLEYERQRKTFIYFDNFVDSLKSYEKSDLTFSDYYVTHIDSLLDMI